jgi:hypothetical protein
MKKIIQLTMFFPLILFTQDLGVYIPMWMMNPNYGDQYFSPQTMDWSRLNWAVAFAIQLDQTKQPYVQILTGHHVLDNPNNATDSAVFEYNYTNTNWLNLLIANGHTNGAKILCGVDMVNPTVLKYVIALGEDSVDLMTRELVAYCNRKGFDGLDLNIETWISTPPTPSQISMLLRHFRYWMTAYAGSCSLLTIAPGQGNSSVYSKDSVNLYVDKIHIQFYAYDPVWYGSPVNTNCSWFINPLRRGSGMPSAFEGQGIEYDLQKWVTAGFKKSKIEIGISTYSWVHKGIDSVMKPISLSGYGTYQYAQGSLSKGGTLHWDNQRKASWIGGTATSSFGSGQTAVAAGQKFYITSPSDSNTYYIIKYAADSSYGGVWFYDLSQDHSESSNPKNPVINYAQKLLQTQGPSDPPSPIYPEGTFSVSPAILPAGGGMITLVWTSSQTASASINQGIGTVTLNGSCTATVTEGTTFTLTLSNTDGTTTYNASVAVSSGQIDTNAEVIYQNVKLNSGWNDIRSWSVTTDYANKTTVNSGTTSIKVVHRPWASLQFSQGTWGSFVQLNPGAYRSFDFAVNGGSNGISLNVQCVNTSGNGMKAPVIVTIPANTWLQESIPINQLTDGEFTAVAVTAGGASTTFFLDQVELASSQSLPVELTTFSVHKQKNSVELFWKTATEIQNYGFDIERKRVSSILITEANSDWDKVGFVNGVGTSNAPQSYSYIDNKTVSGKYVYRLKQIDNNGKYRYSQEIEVEISDGPLTFKLAQNYPNPFNPETHIQYSLSNASHVLLTVFDITGREVATLVNSEQTEGEHEVPFSGVSLASGMYIYCLRASDNAGHVLMETKKMILMR